MSDIPLRCCPFCGCGASIIMNYKVYEFDNFRACCNNPHCRMQSAIYYNQKDLINAWNKRAKSYTCENCNNTGWIYQTDGSEPVRCGYACNPKQEGEVR